jgi:hypothetical protein
MGDEDLRCALDEVDPRRRVAPEVGVGRHQAEEEEHRQGDRPVLRQVGKQFRQVHQREAQDQPGDDGVFAGAAKTYEQGQGGGQDDGEDNLALVGALREELWFGSGAPIGLSWDITETLKGNAGHWVRRYEDDTRSASEQASRDAKKVWQGHAERIFQADLLRDIFGNPFRPLPPFAPNLLAWNDGLVRRLAQSAYDDRQLPSGHMDPAHLAVLCDALLDAGCPADPEVLRHLRGLGPHVRGCFAVDLILGKA